MNSGGLLFFTGPSMGLEERLRKVNFFIFTSSEAQVQLVLRWSIPGDHVEV